ncbi:MAG: phosphoribosylglycinamide formyltransferase [Rikenellaceae bacterium]
MTNIAIFVSGSGTNAENIISYFKGSKKVKVKILLSNKSDAFALERARRNGVPSLVFSSKELRESSLVEDALENCDVDIIILAGFLLLLPKKMIDKYRGRIINIHPALLPAYGGKGMYGENVHKAIVAAGEKESGITIHHVNENFDDGSIIFQAKCSLSPSESVESLAAKIHVLEQANFPRVIEEFIDNSLYSNHKI